MMVAVKRYITKFRALISVVILMVGLCGCEKESGEDKVIEDVEVKHFVEFACSVKSENEATSKVTGDGFEVGDEIGMFAYPYTSSIFGTGEFARWNIPYLHTGKELLVAEGVNVEPIYFSKDVGVLLDFIGYYPYSDKISADGFLRIGNISNQAESAYESILYSNNANEVSRTASFVSLSFEYVMAQVIVNIVYDLESVPDGDVANIESVALVGDGLHINCNFHVATGNIKAVVESEDISRGIIKMKAGMGQTFASVVPSSVEDMELRIGTSGYTYIARPSDITYENGLQYTYNVTLTGDPADGKDVVELGDLKAIIIDWVPGNGEDGEDIVVPSPNVHGIDNMEVGK